MNRVIVSDGASSDGTPDEIRKHFPYVTLLTDTSDPGYAAATNRGAAAGNGDVIVLLNNDTFARPDFVEHLVPVFDDERVGAERVEGTRERIRRLGGPNDAPGGGLCSTAW